MKQFLRNLTRGVLSLLLGVCLYYGRAAWIAMDQSAAAPRPAGPVALIDHVDGAALLAAAQLAVDQPASLTAEVEQAGTVAGRSVSLAGQYQQQGRGEDRRFCWTLTGKINSATLRLWQVTVGPYLWTDLAWNEGRPGRGRSVERVDLAQLRARLAPNAQLDEVGPGQARAAFAQPELWPTQGGLPALLEGLRRGFTFGPPAMMQLSGEPVYALVGRSVQNPGDGGPMPHHVLVLIEAKRRLPVMIEYRAPTDPLSADSLADTDRLVESRVPQLKIAFRKLRLGGPVDADRFAYYPPPDVAWTDATELKQAALSAQPPR